MTSVQHRTLHINDLSDHRLLPTMYLTQKEAYERLATMPEAIRLEAHAVYHALCYYVRFSADDLDYEHMAKEIGLDPQVIEPIIDALIVAGLLDSIFDDDDTSPDETSIRDPGYVKKPIPNSLRKQVFERDGYRCVKCGDWHDLHADHIFPERKGGLATLDNLQTLCKTCNIRKGARVE